MTLTVYVSLGLLGGGENTGRFAHIVCALAGPRDVSGVPRGEDVDRHAVHHKGAVSHLKKTNNEKCRRIRKTWHGTS